MVIDHFLQDITPVTNTKWETHKKFKSLITEQTFVTKDGKKEKLILVKPQTFMNDSGESVEAITSFYKIEPFDVWVVHDELDLPSGSMKIRKGGSGAGHHGVESIMEHLGTEMFWRFRMGIGVNKNHQGVGGKVIHNVDDFVLSDFTSSEAGKVRELIKRGCHALTCALEESLEVAMNKYNTK
jgi:PTH1 family peptidyl-tRNA hydrolase